MADAAADLPEELVIDLPKPLEHEGQSWSRLVLREPLVGEVRELNRHEGATSTIVGVSVIAGVPEAALRTMGASKLRQAERYLEAYIGWEPPAQPKQGPPASFELTLRKPIPWADEPIARLDLREPTSGELERIEQKTGLEAAVLAVIIVAAVPEKVVDQMTIRDLNAAADYLMGFLS